MEHDAFDCTRRFRPCAPTTTMGMHVLKRCCDEDVREGTASLAVEKGDQRKLVFHYHLFKNAGTSVDETLRRNFGRLWAKREFPLRRRENAAAVGAFITEHPRILAISSHTAHLPVPRVDGVEIFPIVFVRHPIDRLRSVYEFERGQNANTQGARLAKINDFAGYLRALLQNPHHRQIRNFQTFRLAQNEVSRQGSEFQRATAAVEALPFVGLVERFDDSLGLLRRRVRPIFPRFRVHSIHRNAAPARLADLPARLAAVEATVGRELFADICNANSDDLALFGLVNSKFACAGSDLGYMPDNLSRQRLALPA